MLNIYKVPFIFVWPIVTSCAFDYITILLYFTLLKFIVYTVYTYLQNVQSVPGSSYVNLVICSIIASEE